MDISVTILTDGANPEITGAKTSYDASGVTSGTPGWSGHRRKDGAVVVDTLTGPYELKGTITIQTVYGPGAKSTDTSLYGRGTTPKDLADGNTTLGFHESCHREDYLGYLKTKPLPVFTGKARMTESDYASAQTAFKNAVDKYLKDMETASHSKTDEVGYKKSECIKDGKCRS
ncbi:MAG TPA: hypothetical protein VFF47_01330 [Nitrospirota bacterium]|nr:hypothetical protein [Nitrospirota bacterium]